ncbi:GNAT family N-acetyltransferase [Aliivibrio sifiae]|uniref:N-acetyltransferase domain-containing protein n=1 Tax=Aliivibrio sifiae TaxID=566293 RepID=A0A2S7X2P3_9GAMM|nr:GNAT family N-acetyltransferase [Aliivibrio sifiae]PQJ84481.1 hypothetical protein BTO22_13205 [Aliivibrio sifiae]
MKGFSVSKVSADIVEEHLNQTGEINIGHDGYERSFFAISNGVSTAYAVIYDLYDEDDFAELARFFVPLKYRNKGVGRKAAILLLNYLFEIKTNLLIDPVDETVDFWWAVAAEVGDSISFESIDGPKAIWSKI